jgi:ABC-2 type transport system permease protein
MFLALIVIKLKVRRENRPWYVHFGRYVAVATVGLFIGYISSQPILTVYFDASATRRNTIHPREQQLIKQFGDSALEVTVYTNVLGKGISFGMPESRNSWLEHWDPYLRFKPDIRFKYEYYYDYDPAYDDSALYKQYPGKTLKEIATQFAASDGYDLSLFKSPEEMRKIIDLRPEHYGNTTQLQYRGQKEFIHSTYASTFKRLLYPAQIPHVYFLTGELERSILKTGEREYSENYRKLVADGFDVDTLNLGVQDIPSNTTVLILADPKMDLPATVQNKLVNYINGGGNMLVISQPGKQYVMNPFLHELGVQLMIGQLVEPSFQATSEKVWAFTTSASDSLSEELSDNIKIWGELAIRMPGVTGINYAGGASPFVVKRLLVTTGGLKEDSFATAIQLTRLLGNREQRIIVCSGADFASNKWGALRFNGLFFNAICSWFDNNIFPVYIPFTPPKDNVLRISVAAVERLKIAYVWVFPAILLLTASLLLIRRRRK